MAFDHDLVVVGASFAGLMCARAAALEGLRVLVVERKADVGDKLHTTGLIVKDAIDDMALLQEMPAHLGRKIEAVRLYSPNLRHVDLRAPGYYFLATDTPNTLRWLAEQAQKAGVVLLLSKAFRSVRHIPGGLDLGELGTSRYLVGADGPMSSVARSAGLGQNKHFLYGIEHEYPSGQVEPDFLHCFISKRLAPGYIGWAFEGAGMTQVGLARRQRGLREKKPDMPEFLNLVPRIQPESWPEPLAIRAGMIPCGGIVKPAAKDKILLTGDAAGMVSPVTAGGIHTALKHGEEAGHAIARHLAGKAPDPASAFVQTYPQFRFKRFLRWGFDQFQADWMFNLFLGNPLMKRAAAEIYFHRRKAFG